MSLVRWILAGAVLTAQVTLGAEIVGSAQAGRQVFGTQRCIQCHSINGQGGKSATDLGKRIGRDYTPTAIVALMWNHAPQMWEAIRQAGIQKPELTEQSAADLYAYFAASGFFEAPGDAGRGKNDFTALHCSACHGISESRAAGAPPVEKWESLANPIALAAQMWDHSARMKEEFAKKHLPWIELTGQQLTDILVYLQNLPETRNLAGNLEIPESGRGQELFQSKGCAACHTGSLALENRLHSTNLAGIAAAMWDHEPLMKSPPQVLTGEEMQQILGYIWARQYSANAGNAATGRKVFRKKHCATCHDDASSGAPNLTSAKRQYSDITMIVALWEHGPHMLDAMRQKNILWPRFNTAEMSDLIGYLNSFH